MREDIETTLINMQVADKILIIDDDVELTELISRFLIQNGFDVGVCHEGDKAEEAIKHFSPELIVLDLMLPGIDGLTICRNIRDTFSGPIIMLTALNDDIDEVTGLEVGADDYLTKPVKPRVLLAHIRAQLRRQSKLEHKSSNSLIVVNNGLLSIDAGKRVVTQDGHAIPLSSAEFDLLWELAQDSGHIISRDALHKRIFRLEYDGIDRSIDLRISRLRKKLGDDPKEPTIIKTIRNKGYLLAD